MARRVKWIPPFRETSDGSTAYTTPHALLRKRSLLSKLATLELCGWIEVSMDDIVIRMAKRLLSDPVDRATYESEFVNRVHGFDYQIHFRLRWCPADS